MKEEFILPKFWYLRITNENKEFIQRWRKLAFNLDDSIDEWYCVNEKGWVRRRGGWRGFLKNSQFITYVYDPLFNTQPSTIEDYSYLIPFIQKLDLNPL